MKEMAGIMLCQHIAVATSGATSGTNGSSFEHHAILDAYAPNGACYIHVSSIGSATGEMRVIRRRRESLNVNLLQGHEFSPSLLLVKKRAKYSFGDAK